MNLTRNKSFVLVVVIAIAIGVAVTASRHNNKQAPEPVAADTPLPREVALIDLAHYANTGKQGDLAATPDALVVHSEGSGKITRLTSIGSKVASNEVIAEIENSVQRAQLTSAEGAYEAAVAGRDIATLGSTPSATGLVSAEAGARTAIGAAYNFIDDALRSKTDFGFDNHDSDDHRRFLVDTDIDYNTFVHINNERASFNSAFVSPTAIDRMSDDAELENLIKEEGVNLTRLQTYLSDLAVAWSKANQHGTTITPDFIASQKATIAGIRAALPQIQGQLSQAQIALANAKLGKDTNARQTGAGGSAAAQVKIAQGNLDLARAAYEKTLIRAPRGGVIVSEGIHEGDIISPGTNAALIAPTAVSTLNGPTWSLPITAVKYDPDGTFIYTVSTSSTIEAHPVTTGLLTSTSITVAGATGTDMIIKDVRGLQEGEKVIVQSSLAK